MNVTGGGRVTSSNSYSGATTISGTLGWFGTHTFYLNNAYGLGAASGDLTVSGGTFDLANNTLTRSGNITITGGTINNGTISKSGTSYDIQGGVINAALAGTAGLTKSGTGNAAVYGANTYSGATVINAGSLVVGSATGLGDAAGAVTVNSGGNLYVGSGLTISRTGNLTVNGGTLSGDNANLGTISLSGGGNFVANNGAALAVKLGGTGGLTVGGTGDTYLWASNSYTGATVINSGQLILGGNGAISESSAVQIDSGAAFLLTGAFAPNNINRTIAGLTGAGILWGAGGTVTVNKASGTDTFTGDIQSGQGLIKSGSGTLVLGGASSYTGATTVSAGTLLIAHGSALGSTAAGTTVASGAQLRLNATNSGFTIGNEALTISGQGVTTGGALRNAAGNNTVQGKVTLAANATIGAASGTSLTLDVASGNAIEASDFNLTFDGAGTNVVNDAISLGTGGLTKIGSGVAILAASNSYSGGTFLNVGYLTAGHNNAFGTGSITVGSGTTLNLTNFAVANSIINNGGTILSTGQLSDVTATNGTSDIGGNNSTIAQVGGSATVNVSGSGVTVNQATGGTINANASGLVVTNFSGGNIAVSNGVTVGLRSGTSGGVISGSGGIAKQGATTLTLTASNTYTGATTVEAGKLQVNGSISSATTVQNGATLGGGGSVASVVIQSGGTIEPGNSPGTLTITNGLTWAGGGNYNWQIYAVSGTAGQTNTWDLINVTGGTWDITGLSSTNKFNINLWSLSGLPDTTGLATGFDATQNYSWKILSSVGLSTTFNAAFFTINTNAINGTGGFVGATGIFSLAVDGNDDLFLSYAGGGAPVPEPGTWAVAALLALGAAYARRRRGKCASAEQ